MRQRVRVIRTAGRRGARPGPACDAAGPARELDVAWRELHGGAYERYGYSRKVKSEGNVWCVMCMPALLSRERRTIRLYDEGDASLFVSDRRP